MMKTYKVQLSDSVVREVRLDDWKKDVPDPRDYRLKSPSSVLPGAKVTRPSKVDLSKKCSPVEDQAQLGSCTAQMLVGMVEYNNIRWSEKPSRRQISRLFQYYVTRKNMGTIHEDSGAYIRDTIKAAAQYGSVWETNWRYRIEKFAEEPPAKVWEKAKLNKITSYHRIDDGDLETMKHTLASGYLIGFGFLVYENFLTQKMATEGILRASEIKGPLYGGHAVVLCGFDDDRRMFKVRNSWGKEWGIDGYYWMDYDYVSNPNLCNDFWVVTSVNKV